VFDESDVIELSPEIAGVAPAVVRERHRVFLLLAAFAFQVWLSTFWVALVEPSMYADHAQKSPHDRHRPRTTGTVKACAR
jgi:hypothetical protein